MIREVDGGSSHASQNSSIVHFGLGENKIVDSLVIHWPGGKSQSLTNVNVNEIIEINEDQSQIKSFWNIVFEYFKVR